MTARERWRRRVASNCRTAPTASARARGFTTIELLIALAVVGMVGLSLVRFFGAQQRGYARQARVVLATQNMRGAADLLLAEARNAGFDPRGTADAALTHATFDSVGWTADLNEDGDASDFGPQGDEAVVYFHDPGRRALMRRTNGREDPILEGVDTVAFRFFDAAGNPTTSPATATRLEILIRFDGGEEAIAATLLTGTRLPNLEWR